MKSKTSCFNKTIFKKNITHFWPIWMVILGWNLFTLPFMLYNYAMSYSEADKLSHRELEAARICDLASAIEDYASPVFLFIFSVLAVMAVFSYLYNSRSAYTMHAFPVTRKELFVTNYISGLLFLIVPEFIGFLTGILVSNLCGYPHTNYLLKGLLFALGISFFFYSFTVFIAMFTGQLFAVPVFALILNLLYVVCDVLGNVLVSLFSYGLPAERAVGFCDILSPLYYMCSKVGTEYDYSGSTTVFVGFEGEKVVLGYALAAIIFVFFAYFVYKNRKVESAEHLISISWIAPVFRWGVAICGALCFSLFLSSMLGITDRSTAFALLMILMIVFGALSFFAAQMFLEKGFRVFQKKRVAECAALMGVLVVFLVGVKCDLFGWERKVPEVADVEKVYVAADYIFCGTEPEEIKDVQKLHQQIIASKKEFQGKEEEANIRSVEISYVLKGQGVVKRVYSVPFVMDDLENPDSVMGKIVELMDDKEVLMENLFGPNYDEVKLKKCTLDLYREDEEYTTLEFDEEKTYILYEALKKDLEEGNYTKSLSYFNPDEYEEGDYLNELWFQYDYDGKAQSLRQEYYHDVEGGEMYYDTDECYFRLNKECKNLIGALVEIGAVQSEEELMQDK